MPKLLIPLVSGTSLAFLAFVVVLFWDTHRLMAIVEHRGNMRRLDRGQVAGKTEGQNHSLHCHK